MKILINVANMSSAGGLSVGLGVVESILKINDPELYFDIIVPSFHLYPFKNTSQVKFTEVPTFFRKTPGNFLLSLYLSRLCKKTAPDKIFSMGNIPIVSSIEQLVMVHWPYLVYPDHPIWSKMNWKEKIVRKIKIKIILSRMKYVNAFTVQTQIMKERLGKLTDKQIHVVPSNFAPLQEQTSNSDSLVKADANSRFLLYLTRYYVHKNLEVFIPLAKIIRSNNSNYKILLTVSENQPGGAQKFLETVKKENLQDVIINLGPVSHKDLKKLYNDSDAFIMPSLLETVGLTYLEAMSEGLPIFTSNLDFAKDICKDVAFYFDPLNAEDIFQCLNKAFADKSSLQSKTEKGLTLSKTFPDWNTITGEYIRILKQI